MEKQNLKINEIYSTLIGEGGYAGMPCVIVRLSGCNLRCSYCDTKHAYENGIEMTVEQVMRSINKFRIAPVLITGGEPLLQTLAIDLMERLVEQDNIVLLETNGSLPVKDVQGEVLTIMDIKCPSSGESAKNLFENIDFLTERDSIKFVLSDRGDYDWAIDVIDEEGLEGYCHILMSPVYGKLNPRDLAQWMIDDGLIAKMSLQLHKIIWDPDERGR